MRLAMRVEGSLWVAYHAWEGTMEHAIFLGSIRMAGIVNHPDRRAAFMELMRQMMADCIEDLTGQRPGWEGERPAPEIERGGNS